jgi:hypothetical protein
MLVGCTPGGGGGDDDPVVKDPSEIVWSQDMSKAEMVEILLTIGISLPPDATSDEVRATLEQETGCGCFGATCGTGYCDHQCGTCDGDLGQTCFSGTCVVVNSCPEMALTAAEESAILKIQLEAGTQRFRYEASLGGNNLETIRIMTNTTTADALGPGTYDLRLFDISSCELCARAYRQCADGSCGESYVATAGKLTIEQGFNDTALVGTLDDLLFEESYEDPKTGSVYVLNHANVKRHCVGSMTLNSDIEEMKIEPTDCDPEGDGVTVGSAVADFEALNCLGETLNLHSACGSKAVWVVGAAGW